jgi:hypothetical protein
MFVPSNDIFKHCNEFVESGVNEIPLVVNPLSSFLKVSFQKLSQATVVARLNLTVVETVFPSPFSDVPVSSF